MKYVSLIVALLCLLTACIGTNVKVEKNEFSAAAYQTYAWSAAPLKIDARKNDYYYFDYYLRRSVDRLLAQKGYQLVAKPEADFVVEYRYLQSASVDQGGISSPLDAQNAAWDIGRDVNSTALYNHYVPTAIQRGNLVILLDDTKTKKTVWQGVATKIIENDVSDENAIKHAANSIVPKLLASIPAR